MARNPNQKPRSQIYVESKYLVEADSQNMTIEMFIDYLKQSSTTALEIAKKQQDKSHLLQEELHKSNDNLDSLNNELRGLRDISFDDKIDDKEKVYRLQMILNRIIGKVEDKQVSDILKATPIDDKEKEAPEEKEGEQHEN